MSRDLCFVLIGLTRHVTFKQFPLVDPRSHVIRLDLTEFVEAYPFADFVVERSGHVDGARHVLDSKSTALVTFGDFVTDFRSCQRENTQIR